VCVGCRQVLGNSYIKELRAIIGRGGHLTFAPPPGYNLEKRTQLSAVAPKPEPGEQRRRCRSVGSGQARPGRLCG
jgi:hypothetical protein